MRYMRFGGLVNLLLNPSNFYCREVFSYRRSEKCVMTSTEADLVLLSSTGRFQDRNIALHSRHRARHSITEFFQKRSQQASACSADASKNKPLTSSLKQTSLENDEVESYITGSIEGKSGPNRSIRWPDRKMGGIFPFSLVEFYQRRLEVLYRSCGLESRLVDLEDGTLMKCWIPQRNKARALTLSAQKENLVLLHAFGTSGNSWNKQVKAFSKLFDLYIPDLVFFGDSTTTRTERTEIFQAQCVVRMLEQLGVTKYSVIGTSYGGFVAYRIAHLYPESVNKLVISSAGVTMDPSSDEALIAKFNVGDIKDIILPTTVEGMRRVISLGVYKQLPFPVPKFVCEDYLRVVANKNFEERAQLVDGLVLGKAHSPPLETVPQDVLIVWGEFDEIFDVKLAHQLREHIGQKAKVFVIKNTAHAPQMEKASEYNNVVLDFLAENRLALARPANGMRFRCIGFPDKSFSARHDDSD